MKRTISPEQHPFYHNTLKLLQNYRDVKWSLEVSAQNLQSEFRAEYGGASAAYVDDLTINGDKSSAARIEGLTFFLDKSRRMMQLVNSAKEVAAVVGGKLVCQISLLISRTLSDPKAFF